MSSKDLRMDPKGACFLSLHDISNCSGATEDFETSLKIIFRYLKIDSSAFTQKAGTSKENVRNEEDGFEKLGISLCEICASQSKHLCNLILQLERIQKCVMRELQVFKDAMSEYETSPSHLTRRQDEGLAGSSGNEEKTRLLKALRQETKEKSSATWLNLLGLMKPKSPAIQCGTENHRPVQQIPSFSSVVRSETTATTLTNNLDVTNYTGQLPPSLEGDNIVMSSDQSGTGTECQPSGQRTPASQKSQTSFSSNKEFKAHLVLRHSNLLEKKLPGILANPTAPLNTPKTKKKSYMSRTMKKIGIKRYPTGGNQSIAEDGKRVLRYGRSVTSDPDVANQTKKRQPNKVKNLSSSDNPLLSAIFKKLCKNSASGYSRCGVCKEVKVPKKLLLSKHLVNTHPEEFFSQIKLPEISEQHFKSCCHHILNETSESASLQTQESGENFHLCPICSQVAFPNHYDLKYHFVLEHFQDLQLKLTALQQEAMDGSIQFMDQVEEDPLNASGASDLNEDVDDQDDGSIEEEEMIEMSSFCEVKIKTEDLPEDEPDENRVGVEGEEENGRIGHPEVDGVFMECEDAIEEGEEMKPIIDNIYSLGASAESILPDL